MRIKQIFHNQSLQHVWHQSCTWIQSEFVGFSETTVKLFPFESVNLPSSHCEYIPGALTRIQDRIRTPRIIMFSSRTKYVNYLHCLVCIVQGNNSAASLCNSILLPPQNSGNLWRQFSFKKILNIMIKLE